LTKQNVKCEWQQRWDEECWEWLVDHLAEYSPADLIEVAETGRDLGGRTLQRQEWALLDAAWQAKFGEPYFDKDDRDDKASEPDGFNSAPVDSSQHPILSLPDDALVRSRKLAGVSTSGKGFGDRLI
jgi:hypothetical protein